MATEKEINATCRKLDTLERKFSKAFERRNVEKCDNILRQCFSTIRYGHAKGTVPDEELTQHVRQWKDNVLELANISPGFAFKTADVARQMCAKGPENLACDELIVNTACLCVKSLAVEALNSSAQIKDNFPLHRSYGYITPLVGVLLQVGPYAHSGNLKSTFSETLTVFENMLYTAYFSPADRYDLVKQVRDLAATNKPQNNKLLLRMDQILSEAVDTRKGQKILLTDMEEQADELGRLHYEYEVRDAILDEMKADALKEADKKNKILKAKTKNPKIISFAEVFASRAGVDPTYAETYQTIEKSFRDKKPQAAEDALYQLFHQLSDNTEDADGEVIPKDVASFAYLSKAAEKLTALSLTHGFRLAARCITAIEEEALFSDYLQEVVYGFSVPAIAHWEVSKGGDYSATHEMNLVMMKRSSEFMDAEQGADIFERASISYREYLGSIDPTQRYDEILQLSIWLGERKYPSPMLEDFVDDLMNMATYYGSFLGIPLEEDDVPHLRGVPSLTL